MKPIFTYRALQPLSLIFKIILTEFCTLIVMSIGIFVTTNQRTNPAVPLTIEWFLICSRFKKFDWDFVSFIIYLSSLWICSMSWISGGLSISSGSVISASFGKYLVVIDSTNFPATFVKSSGVWMTVWPDFTFQKTAFLRVPPTPSIGPLPWCLSL